MTIPKIVAPIGSSKANVDVSNDLRLDKDEKYNVCAIAVGKSPKPTKGSALCRVSGKGDTAFPKDTLTIPTKTAMNP